MRVTRPALVAAVAAAFTLAACGGSSGVSASDYVHQVCTAVQSYETQLQSQSTQIQSQLQSTVASGNYQAVKTQLTTFFTNIINETSSAKDKINKAGKPKVKNGDKVQSTLTNDFQKLQDSLTQAKTKLQSFDPNSKSFVTNLESLGSQISSAGSSIGSSLESSSALGNGDLDSAANKDATCKKIENSSS